MKPSVLVDQLGATGGAAASPQDRRRGVPPPEIIELLNIADYTNQVVSTVDVDEPLFQPSPAVIDFPDYKPFSSQTLTLYMRNNDSVGRRLKVQPTTSTHTYTGANRQWTRLTHWLSSPSPDHPS